MKTSYFFLIETQLLILQPHSCFGFSASVCEMHINAYSIQTPSSCLKVAGCGPQPFPLLTEGGRLVITGSCISGLF